MNGGATFWYRSDPDGTEHLHIVLSDPNAAKVVLVNFTSLRGGGVYHDPTCVVERHEHPALAHTSWISYARAMVVDGNGLREVLRRNLVRQRESVSPELLTRIRQGAIASEHTPLNCREILIEQGLATDDE